MILDEFKYETVISFGIKLLALIYNTSSYYYNQPSSAIIKWPLLKSHENITMHHNFTKVYIP